MKIARIILSLVLLGALQVSNAASLISPKEAALPPASGTLNTRGISRGPAIKLGSPVVDPVESPFDFKLTFEPRGDAKVDPESIKVTYLKFPYVDLTPRLKSAISASGIDFPKADVPPGNHSVRVTVKDTEGRESNLVLNLVVTK